MKIKKLLSKAPVIIIVVVVFMVTIGFNIITCFNDHQYTITVTDKDRIVDKKSDDGEIKSRYLVFGDTEDGESLVFENTDCFLRLKFNSSNFQGKLKEGNTYTITVVGFRVPFLSWYENIIKVEEVQE